ncbi:MAG: peptidoglycan -binding protein [Thiogranum sp.]
MLVANRRRRTVDIWPGFVDALAALLMVVMFVLLLFSVGQFLLSDALVGRDAALDRLHGQMADLSEVLALERKDKAALQQRVSRLTGELEVTLKARDTLQARVGEMTLQAQDTATAIEQLESELKVARSSIAAGERLQQQQRDSIAGLEADRQRLSAALDASREDAARQKEIGVQAQRRATDLDTQIAALNEQLARLNQALEASEAAVQEKDIKIEDLGRRLNLAMADKVEELARYRSEFFGKLREALQDNPDVRIEGDRFILPTEVLFSSASADLDKQGRQGIGTVARTLKEISAQIPDDIDWVLRVDGHTDRRPIRKAFPSNWELSSARAISIVKYMIREGIPPEHLVAAGFGQYHPLDPADTADAYRRNRRIELKLTSR